MADYLSASEKSFLSAEPHRIKPKQVAALLAELADNKDIAMELAKRNVECALLEAKLAEAERALAFYGDGLNYHHNQHIILADYGQRARTALARIRGEKPTD